MKEKELELKYVFEGDDEPIFTKVVDTLTANGFNFISKSSKINNDEYYDTRDLYFYQNGGSLRIRRRSENGSIKCMGTYKMPRGEWTIYSSRTEIEMNLKENGFDSFSSVMQKANVPFKFSHVISSPILNSTTRRSDNVFRKDEDEVCVSFDDITYMGYVLNGIAKDKMVEVEAIGELHNKELLNEIHSLLSTSIPELQITKESKYERAHNKLRNNQEKVLSKSKKKKSKVKSKN